MRHGWIAATQPASFDGRDQSICIPVRDPAMRVDANEMGHGDIGGLANIALMTEFSPQLLPCGRGVRPRFECPKRVPGS